MRTPTKERKSLSYREGSEQEAKKRAESVQEEMDSPMQRPRGSRKRSAKGAKHTKAPMDAEGSKGTCSCGKRPKGKCNCGKEGTVMKDAGCGMKPGRSDALTAPEYLAACDLSIQGRSRTYIRARLDAVSSKASSASLREESIKKEDTSTNKRAFTYGTLINVENKKDKAKVKTDATYANGFNVDVDQLAI
jgi:hypothetical protein